MVASSLDKLASAIDSAGNNRWDFVSRTAFPAFERQVRNTLSAHDLLAAIENDEPTLEDVKKLHPNAATAELKTLLDQLIKEYKLADTAAHGHNRQVTTVEERARTPHRDDCD